MNKLFVYIFSCIILLLSACKDKNEGGDELKKVKLGNCLFQYKGNWSLQKDKTPNDKYQLYNLTLKSNPDTYIKLYLYKEKLITDDSELQEIIYNESLKHYDVTSFTEWCGFAGKGIEQESPNLAKKDKYKNFVGSNDTKTFIVRIHYPNAENNDGAKLFEKSFQF